MNNQKPFVFGNSNQQQGLIDLREELPPVPEEVEEDDDSDGYAPTEIVDTPLMEDDDMIARGGTEETQESERTEPDVEQIPSSRCRSSEDLDDVPISIRRRLSETQLPTESRATESRAPESPLDQTWNRTGTFGAGLELAGRGFEGTNFAEGKDE